MFTLDIDFVLKIKNNQCLLVLCWIKIKQKTALARRELVYSYSLNVWKIEKKEWTCRWEKIRKVIEEVLYPEKSLVGVISLPLFSAIKRSK